MDIDNEPTTKQGLLERLLDKGMVMVHLDARKNGVDVPDQFRDEADLRLNLSYRFQYGDLELETDELRATLNFSGGPYRCEVPLPAVFAIVSHVTGEGFFFPGDAPPEALAALAAMVTPDDLDSEDDDPSPAEVVRPVLEAIDGGRDGDEAGSNEQDHDEPKPTGVPHLRVVK